MKKIFRIQKISMVVYVVAAAATFIYAMYFMTDFNNIRNFILPVNQAIIDLDEQMQSFNFTIYWFSIVALISILMLFIFQVGSKVCDKLALIVTNCFNSVAVIASIIVFITLPGLLKDYQNESLFDYFYFEQVSSVANTKNFTAFYLGFGLYFVLLVAAISLITSTILATRKYIAEKAVV